MTGSCGDPKFQKLTALPTSTLYRYMKEGRFPAPLKIGERAVAWPLSEVQAWLAGERLIGRNR